MISYSRGTIITVDLEANGSVQGGKRPALIVSNNTGNKHSPVLIVVPLTSQTKKTMPTHHKITTGGVNGLFKESIALCEQIITVSKNKVHSSIGYVEEYDMDCINSKLKASLSLI